ncbi:hypothetical protein IAT38_005776 [Cryptococcus sp. DSM 104549]
MTHQPLPSSLKRPRSTSQPPSPSASSSPKRSASEDPFPSGSDSGRMNDLLSPDANGGLAAGSSPLRLDIDGAEEEPDERKNWVQRTGQVHLGSDAGDREEEGQGDVTMTVEEPTAQPVAKEVWNERYNDLIGNLPPPFHPYERYYLLPKPILNKIQLLAFGDDDEDSQFAPGDLATAMKKLVPDESDELFWVIQSEKEAEGSGSTLVGVGKEEKVWALGEAEESVDYVFVSQASWDKVLSWLGPYDGPSLPRYGLPLDMVEIQPSTIRLFIVLPDSTAPTTDTPASDEASQVVLLCPSTTPLPIFQDFVRSVATQKLGLDKVPATWGSRLWKVEKSGENDEKLLKGGSLEISPKTLIATQCKLVESVDPPENLAEAILGSSKSQIVAVEFGKSDGGEGSKPAWSVDANSDGQAVEKAAKPLFSKPAFFGGSGSAGTTTDTLSPNAGAVQTRSQTTKQRTGKGLVGLQNLGNTCFMNSAVQCLSNTQELCQYFLSGVYTDELNRDNPLGMSGQIAEAFGQTVENLWAPTSTMHSSYSPRQLKWNTSKFAPQFAGYGQHDTQEFIAFLLDGLHEDLNRIIKKPYIEKPDWKAGGGDKELAELGKECWEGYKKRNDSVIVDLFQGQLRSTLVCPECHKESITMDPFMYLTVPMPIAQHRHFKLTYVPRDVDKPPVQVKMLIPQNASFMQIKDKLASLVDSKATNIVGFDLWHNKPYQWWFDADHNSECKDNDEAVFYELDPSATVVASRKHKAAGVISEGGSTTGSITVPVYTYRSIESSRGGYRRPDAPSECALKPFFITLSKAEATDPAEVREAIMRGYSRFIKPEHKEDIYVPASSSQAQAAVPTPPKSEDGDAVTEIHLNGDQATVVEVDPAAADAALAAGISGGHHNGSVTSLASHASAPSTTGSHSGRLVPRADLFKVHVADPSGDFVLGGFKSKVVPFYSKDPSSASNHWSLLEARKKKGKKHIVNRIVNSIVSPSYASDDEAKAEGEEAAGEAPTRKKRPQLVVRPGEGIFCEWPSKTFSEWIDVDAMGETVVDPAIAKEIAKKKEGKHIGIEDCLDEFSKEETLGEDDLWYCPVCKKHQAATKKLEIYKAPDILVICIKRFGSSRRMGDKLDNMVHFPIDGLDLEDRIGERKVANTLKLNGEDVQEYGIEEDGEPLVYDLYAVDNHFGGMGGGHYTAFCRNRVDGQWYNYDDSRVSKADASSVQSRAAYLLFYRRRTSRPIGGVSRVKAEEASRNVSRNASRSPSPAAESSTLPSTITSSTFVSGRTSPGSLPEMPSPASSSDELPSYSHLGTPAAPSPTVSDDDAPLSSIRGLSTASVAQSVGFGNTAWTTSSNVASGITHSFGQSDHEAWTSRWTPAENTEVQVPEVPVTLAAASATGGEDVSMEGEAPTVDTADEAATSAQAPTVVEPQVELAPVAPIASETVADVAPPAYAPAEGDKTAGEPASVGGDYEMVESGKSEKEGESDAEMVSVPGGTQ